MDCEGGEVTVCNCRRQDTEQPWGAHELTCDIGYGSDVTAWIGTPDYIAARDALRRVDDAIAAGETTEGEIDAVMACVDAALAGMERIELTEEQVWKLPDYAQPNRPPGSELFDGCNRKVACAATTPSQSEQKGGM